MQARLRFDQEGSASEVLEKAKEEGGGSVKVKDTEVKARVLEGEKEHFVGMCIQNPRSNKTYLSLQHRSSVESLNLSH